MIKTFKISNIDIKLIDELSKKYNITSRVDVTANEIYVYNGIDEFRIEFNPNTNRAPIDVYHRNCRDKKTRFHKQGYYFNFEDCYQDIYKHKFKPLLSNNKMFKMFDKLNSLNNK